MKYRTLAMMATCALACVVVDNPTRDVLVSVLLGALSGLVTSRIP
jgi:hypothetical protein